MQSARPIYRRVHGSGEEYSSGDLYYNLPSPFLLRESILSWVDVPYEFAFGFVRDGDTTRETVYSTPVIVYPAPVPELTVERVLNSDRDQVMLKFSWTDVLGVSPENSEPIYRRVHGSGEEYSSGGLHYNSRSPLLLSESTLSWVDEPYEFAFGFVRDGDTTRETVYSTPVIVYPAAPPATPTNLQVISQHGFLSSVIEVTWDDPNDPTIIGYQITQIDDEDSEIVLVENTQSASNSFTDNFTRPNRNVRYGIRAISPLGMSDQAISPIGRRNAGFMLPSPLNESAIGYGNFAGSSPYIALSWDAPIQTGPTPHNLTGYRIMRKDAAMATQPFSQAHVIVADTGSTSPGYRDDTIDTGKFYLYTVAAINANGVGNNGSTIWDGAMVPSSEHPWPVAQAPGDLAVEKTYGFNEDASATLTWTLPEPSQDYTGYPEDSGITEYRILRRPIDDDGINFTPTGPYQLHATTPNATTTHVISEGVHTDKYEYLVRAINPSGESADSNSVSFRSPAWPTFYMGDVPLTLALVPGFPGETYIDIDWGDIHLDTDYSGPLAEELGLVGYPSDGAITGYQIERRPYQTGNFEILVADTGAGSASTSYRDTSGIEGVHYEYRVAAINPAGVGSPTRSANVAWNSWPPVGLARLTIHLTLVPGFPGESYVDIDWDISTWLDSVILNPQAVATDLVGFPSDGGITGYRIERRPYQTGDFGILVADTGSASPSYRDTSGIEGVRYEYRVSAINPSGVGRWSMTNYVTWNSWPAPQGPGDLAVEQVGDTASATLTWSAPEPHSQSDYAGYPADSGITGYQILWRIAGSGMPYEFLAATAGADVSYDLTLSESDNGVEYEYVVHAVNPSGVGAAAAVSYRLELPPKTPGGLEEAVMLVWAASDDMSLSYQILRRVKDSGADYSVLVNDTNGTDNFYVDNDAAYGVTYQYVVKAINEFGISPSSNPITGRRMGPSAPDAPRNLIGETSNGSVILSWDSPNDSSVTGYRILRRALETELNLTTLVADTGSTSATYTDASAVAGVRYAYRVIAISPAGESRESNFVNVQVQVASASPGVPDKPQNLSGSVSGGNIVLTWDDPSDSTITGYQIRRRTLDVTGAEGSFAVIEANTNSASTSYTDRNVETGVRYAYRIHAINAGGTGTASQPTTVRR